MKKSIELIQKETNRIKEGIEVISNDGVIEPYGFVINRKNEIKARDENSFFIILLSEEGKPEQTLVVFPKIKDWAEWWTDEDGDEGPIPTLQI